MAENLPKLCSGFGQYHSQNHSTNPKKYIGVTLDEISEMMENPQSVAKEKAQWVIPSTLLSRVHGEQRKKGRFYLLWADIDNVSGLTFDELVSRAGGFLECDILAYTTSSATEEHPKSRIILPLRHPVSGEQFVILQTILNNRLESAGITPDRATERSGQPCYLPNKGKFYKSFQTDFLGPFDPETWAEDIARIEAQQEAEEEALHARQAAARAKAAQRVAAGTHSPIQAYNDAYDIPLMFDLCGYTKNGKGWLSPNSESGNPGVTISKDGQKWFSHHASDSEIGAKGDGGTWGDAFDLFVFYQHGGDYNAALKAAGQMFATDEGVSLNKANQRKYMSDKSREETLNAFDAVSGGAGFSLSVFALNGESAAMKKQMLDDKFILGNIALFGQSTIIYSASNVGKTIITIHELIQAITNKTIKPEDVFFINADDNHRGLTFKLMLAEQYKFNMLAPGYKDFKAEMLVGALQAMIEDDTARGKIVILDTVKKFVDLMDKRKGSAFAECVRQFVAHGGSVIMLAHVNKHRGDDGKVVYSGTTDLKDDCDCAYTIDIVTEDKFNGPRTIKFENIKNRGDVATEAIYCYDCSPSLTYLERLDSVYEVKDSEREEVEKMAALEKRYLKNKEGIEAIKHVLRKGEINKTDLIKIATAETAISKRRIVRALDEHTGLNESKFQFWTVETREKNAKIYKLN